MFAKNYDSRTTFLDLGHNDPIEEDKSIVELMTLRANFVAGVIEPVKI